MPGPSCRTYNQDAENKVVIERLTIYLFLMIDSLHYVSGVRSFVFWRLLQDSDRPSILKNTLYSNPPQAFFYLG